MEIIKKTEGPKGYFRADDNGKSAGEITITWAGEDRFIIDHTEVNQEYKGQNIGKKLVLSAIEYAREQNKKIIPLCPFAKSVFDKNEELRDVL